MRHNIGISQKDRDGSVGILNDLIADEHVLYAKTRNYHWHVKRSDFSELHKLFEAQYQQLEQAIDEIAERTRTLGGMSFATLGEFLKATQLTESTKHDLSSHEMLTNLLNDHETIIRSLRKNLDICTDKYHDAGTTDFLTGLMQAHEKTAWMLRSYLG